MLASDYLSEFIIHWGMREIKSPSFIFIHAPGEPGNSNFLHYNLGFVDECVKTNLLFRL